MQLLRERVIDAWICDAVDDLPPPSMRPDLALHPLSGERALTSADLRSFPCLDIPAGVFERSRGLLHSLVPLDAPAPFGNGGALLCHRDLADDPPIQLLLETLRRRLAQKGATLPNLERL